MPSPDTEKMSSNAFKCSYCDGVFSKGWSEEEARAELDRNFGVPVEQCDVVCDDCWKVLKILDKVFEAMFPKERS